MRCIITLFLCIELGCFYGWEVLAQQPILDVAKLTGSYLGQKPPGKTPVPFCPHIVELQNELHTTIAFSSDGKEAYWKPLWNPNSAIYFSRIENGYWSTPAIASFSQLNKGDDSPFISPDGKKLFFISKREVDTQHVNRERIWFAERIGNDWSQPQLLPEIINSMNGIHWQFSLDNNNNLFFGTVKFATGFGTGDIYCSYYKNGIYSEPVKLSEGINKLGHWQYSPFISPDGSYIIFSRQFKRELSKIFISYNKKDGNWTEPIDLCNYFILPKAVNSFVSKDAKHFFFLSGPADNFIWSPYWVDTSFIEELRKTIE